jgi:hypothetical protein
MDGTRYGVMSGLDIAITKPVESFKTFDFLSDLPA